MSAKNVLYEYVEGEGWSEATQLELCLQFIDSLGSGHLMSFQAFLSVRASEVETGQYDEPQDRCPKCGSDDLSNEQPPENGQLFVNCLGCNYQWHEPDQD